MKNTIKQLSLALALILSLCIAMAFTKQTQAENPRTYMVIREKSPEDLEDMVQPKLNAGWHLQGGVALFGGWYCQALSR